MKDPIVEEVRRIRDELSAEFDYDLSRIFAHIKERERASPAPLPQMALDKPNVSRAAVMHDPAPLRR